MNVSEREDAVECECIGPFRILREIGRGQNATVYEAHDTRRDEVVALKVHEVRRAIVGAAPEGAEGTLAAMRAEATLLRFVREADAIRRLAHPNIVRIRDAGAEQGRFYIAMERLHGETLRDLLIERGPLPVREAVAIALQVASALRFAHDQGITHRDVKPDNIFLLPDGTAKLMDFGAAHVLGENSLTQTGTVIGSPAYMAPEQVSGQATNGRTDVWGLAATLFEAVTGAKPFPGESVATVMYAILHKRPDFGLVPSPPLARVLERALAKRPAARFAAVNAFADALRSLPPPGDETGAPPVSPRPSPPRHAAPARTRTVLLAVVVALALAALIWGSLVLMRPQTEAYRPSQVMPPPSPVLAAPPPVAVAPVAVAPVAAAPVAAAPVAAAPVAAAPVAALVLPALGAPATPPDAVRPAPSRSQPAPAKPKQGAPPAPRPAAAPAQPQRQLGPSEAIRAPETNNRAEAAPLRTPGLPARDGAAKGSVPEMPPDRDPEPMPDNPEVVLPDALRRAAFDDTVGLRAHIDEEGKVEEVSILRSSGNGVVDREAAATLREWRYRPALRNGQPARTSEDLEMAVGEAFRE